MRSFLNVLAGVVAVFMLAALFYVYFLIMAAVVERTVKSYCADTDPVYLDNRPRRI